MLSIVCICIHPFSMKRNYIWKICLRHLGMNNKGVRHSSQAGILMQRHSEITTHSGSLLQFSNISIFPQLSYMLCHCAQPHLPCSLRTQQIPAISKMFGMGRTKSLQPFAIPGTSESKFSLRSFTFKLQALSLLLSTFTLRWLLWIVAILPNGHLSKLDFTKTP